MLNQDKCVAQNFPSPSPERQIKFVKIQVQHITQTWSRHELCFLRNVTASKTAITRRALTDHMCQIADLHALISQCHGIRMGMIAQKFPLFERKAHGIRETPKAYH